MAPSDKWNELPDVVAQLQAEAARPPAPQRRPARFDDDDDTCIRIAEVPDDNFVEFAPRARSGAHELTPRPTPRPMPAAEREVPGQAADEAATPVVTEGLPDYVMLAADPRPDLRALARRLKQEIEAGLGVRATRLMPLLDVIAAQIDQHLASGAGPKAAGPLLATIDQLEDFLAPLVVIR
jgi:hypothetical protein